MEGPVVETNICRKGHTIQTASGSVPEGEQIVSSVRKFGDLKETNVEQARQRRL